MPKVWAAGAHKLVVDFCEVGGGEAFRLRYQGPDSGGGNRPIPTWALKRDAKALPGRRLQCVESARELHEVVAVWMSSSAGLDKIVQNFVVTA